MGDFISFIWMVGGGCRHLLRRRVCRAEGGGAPGCPVPDPRSRGPLGPSPGGPGPRALARLGVAARCVPEQKSPVAGLAGGRGPGWARGPGAFCLAQPSGRGPQFGLRWGRGAGRPAGWSPERGGRGSRLRRPRPRAAGLIRPKARAAAQRTGSGIKVVGGGGTEEQGEASSVLNASRVRLIIKLIKASI